jgi:hypothetical protein
MVDIVNSLLLLLLFCFFVHGCLLWLLLLFDRFLVMKELSLLP